MFLLLRLFHMVHHGLHVFVATARKVEHHQVIFRQVRCAFEHFGQGVCAFQCRNNPFQAAAFVERLEGFVVGHRGVLDAADIMQPGVFRADARVVEAGGNRVGVNDLAVIILQQEGAVAVQHARYATV